MKGTIKKILKEFTVDKLNSEDYKDGQLTLEYVEGYDYPRYVLYYDTDEDQQIVAELDSRFFDGHMSETIMHYILTRE